MSDLNVVCLHIIQIAAILLLWSTADLPDSEAETLDKLAVIAAMHTDQLVTRWDAELLPLARQRDIGLSAPHLVKHEVTRTVHESDTLDVARPLILVDVDVC